MRLHLFVFDFLCPPHVADFSSPVRPLSLSVGLRGLKEISSPHVLFPLSLGVFLSVVHSLLEKVQRDRLHSPWQYCLSNSEHHHHTTSFSLLHRIGPRGLSFSPPLKIPNPPLSIHLFARSIYPSIYRCPKSVSLSVCLCVQPCVRSLLLQHSRPLSGLASVSTARSPSLRP